MKTDNQAPGQFPSPGEVRFVRLLPGPIERVWAYLTDPEKRSRWFAGGPMELKPGGKMQLQFRHRDLAPNEVPPAKYQEVHETGFTMDLRVLRCEPPRLLAYTFDEESDVTFELTPIGDQVQLVLTHRCRGGDLPSLPNYSAGWHTHLSILIALLEDTATPPFWATHGRLHAEYNQKLSSPAARA